MADRASHAGHEELWSDRVIEGNDGEIKRAVLMDLELLAVVCEKTADIRGRLPDGSPELGLLESVSASAHQGTAFADSVRGLHNYFISRGDVRGLYGFVREGTYDCEPHSRGLRPAGVP